MSARGGKRPGSGRKVGAKSAITKLQDEVAAAALSEGITPLEVLLRSMRTAWEANEIEAATRYAEKAAPYVHQKLASMDVQAKGNLSLTINIVRFSDMAEAA